MMVDGAVDVGVFRVIVSMLEKSIENTRKKVPSRKPAGDKDSEHENKPHNSRFDL